MSQQTIYHLCAMPRHPFCPGAHVGTEMLKYKYVHTAAVLTMCCLLASTSIINPMSSEVYSATVRVNDSSMRHDSLRLPIYEQFHHITVSCRRETRLMVVHLNGGWGNQFHTLMGSLPLAVALNRTLILKFPWPEAVGAALQPNRVDWKPWNAAIFTKTQSATAFDATSMSIGEISAMDSKDVLHVDLGGTGVWGYRNYDTWSSSLHKLAAAQGLDLNTLTFAGVFDYLFKMTPALESKINQLRATLSPDGRPYLAMHIRTGGDEVRDMLKHNFTHFVDEDSAMETMPRAAMHAMHVHALPSTTTWMLATDSFEFARRMQDKFPRNVFISNKNLPVTNGLHINRGAGAEGAILTFADWFLMIRATVLLQAGPSSYSGSAIAFKDAPCAQLDEGLYSSNQRAKLMIRMCPPSKTLDVG